jgi:beta-galactosidase
MEARQVAAELKTVGDLGPCGRADVALVMSYEADWQFSIQPHARGFSWIRLAFEAYSTLRRLGLSVDFVPPGAEVSGYKLVVCPSLPILEGGTLAALERSGALVLLGPRTGSRTRDGAIPPNLPPGPLQDKLPMKVLRVEGLRPGAGPTVLIGDQALSGRFWREIIETSAEVLANFQEGGPALLAHGPWRYLATWPEPPLFEVVVRRLAADAGLTVKSHDPDVRTQRRDGVTFAFNFGPEPRATPAPAGATYVLGGPELPVAGVAAWR